MSLLQGLNENYVNTFNDLGVQILSKMKDCFRSINYVALVYDRCDDISIKNAERVHRDGNHGKTASHQIGGERVVPKYKSYMSNSSSKTAFAQLS